MDFDDILPGASRAVAVTVGAIDSVTKMQEQLIQARLLHDLFVG